MIELDEPVVLPQDLEFARCTCLDRARIALEQTGQHHCAGVMGELQEEFDYICKFMETDPNDPIWAMREICEYLKEEIREWEHEKER